MARHSVLPTGLLQPSDVELFHLEHGMHEEIQMAEVGTKLIFENERVRVWEFTLQPGESIDAHHHDHDFFFYPIEGGTLEVTRATGVTRLTLNAGEVYFRTGGDTHAAKNVDDHRYHEVLVELKD
jgi:quercetin dioxygenase-like cupin family protein